MIKTTTKYNTIVYLVVSLGILLLSYNVHAKTKLIEPPGNSIYFSAFPDFGGSEDNVTAGRITDFENLAGKNITWAEFSLNWLNGIVYPQTSIHAIYDQGVFPLLRLMPRSDFDEGHQETVYSLQKIIDGEFDTQLHQMAQDAKADNIPFGIDFAVEPTGDWFGWSGVFNGGGVTDQYGDPTYPDGPERWRDAYRHIIDIFRAENVTNVTWFFHPDIQREPDEEWNSAKYYYPGDDYIDWIGISIYGAQIPTTSEDWVLFSELLENNHQLITEISNQKPFCVLEFGVTDDYPSQSKSDWLNDAFATILDNPYINFKAINYWHENWENEDTGNPETKLRIDSSPGVLDTFRNLISNNRFISSARLSEIRADVDDNSQINSTDAMLTLRNSLGLDMSGTDWQASGTTGDVNCDGNSNSTDAMLILRYSLGLDMSGTGWCEGSSVYGYLGDHTVLTHTEVDEGNTTIYYPSDMSPTNKVPVVFFTPGWLSANPQDYQTLLNFIASHGYAVIYSKDNYGSTKDFIQRFEKMLDNNNDILPSLDTTKIGVVGHSSGGGDTFRVFEYFSNKGYGQNGRFLMALDPWFAFDMTSERMRSLPSNSNIVILQFGDDGGDTDARIPLSEYALLDSITDNKKDYQVYNQENADHSYPTGDKPVEDMQGVLKPLDALMDYTFGTETQQAHDVALKVGSDDPYNTGLQSVREIFQYPYRCNSHKNRSEVMDIDYCYQYLGGKTYPADTIFDNQQEANVSEPNYLASYIDPVFGNRVTRITDRANQDANTHNYPKTQSWNADMSLIRFGYRLYNTDDFSESSLTTNQHLRGSLTEMKWSSYEPDVFYGIDVRADRFVFVKATIDNQNNTVTYEDMPNATFMKSEYDELKLGKYEGNLDDQDNYVVFAGRKKDTNRVTLIVYHLKDNYGTDYNVIESQKTFNDLKWYVEDDSGNFNVDSSESNQMFDWASISALGNYVIVNYRNKKDDPEQEYTIEQYDRDLNHIRRLAEHGDHGDLGLDVNDNEVYVQFGFGTINGQDNRGIWLYPLDGSPRVQLLPDKYNGGHISCRNYQRPGWCYVNTRYLSNGSGVREVFALKLDGSGTVERFAQTHNSTGNAGYTQVGVSPDGTQVLFASDWGDGQLPEDTFLVTVE